MKVNQGIPKGMVDVAGLCEAFGVQAPTIQKWARNGKIPKPAMRMGRKLLWNPDVIEEALKAFAARVDVHHNLKPKQEVA